MKQDSNGDDDEYTAMIYIGKGGEVQAASMMWDVEHGWEGESLA